MAELKPCPFCGGEARFRITSIPEGEQVRGYIHCADYCCEQGHVRYYDEAVEEWNWRAEDDK